jgi:hypothetical protein
MNGYLTGGEGKKKDEYEQKKKLKEDITKQLEYESKPQEVEGETEVKEVKGPGGEVGTSLVLERQSHVLTDYDNDRCYGCGYSDWRCRCGGGGENSIWWGGDEY